MSETATYLFDREAVRRSDEPPEDTVRLVWMIVVLLRERSVTYERYAGLFARTTRTFKRDLKKLHDLGDRFGFSLTRQRRGEVRLTGFDDDPRERRRRSASEAAGDVLSAVTDALGEVVASSVRGWAEPPATSGHRFLRLATPRLRAGSDVALVFDRLRDAWRAGARVRFRYPTTTGALTERIVEPRMVSYNAGRYYLIGFDIRPQTGGWRQYALDRIVEPLDRAGTCSPRPVPIAYAGEDALGLFKTGVECRVTIAFSDVIAQAVIAREWQRGEQIGRDALGRTTLTVTAYDLGEIVRWALGFGTEATILSPPEAVALVRETIATLRDRYVVETSASRTA